MCVCTGSKPTLHEGVSTNYFGKEESLSNSQSAERQRKEKAAESGKGNTDSSVGLRAAFLQKHGDQKGNSSHSRQEDRKKT